MTPQLFALYVRYASGHVSVRTFDSAFDRALEMILLAAQPVTLTVKDF